MAPAPGIFKSGFPPYPSRKEQRGRRAGQSDDRRACVIYYSHMGLFGGKKPSSYLGVDIGASGIKVVELENEKGRAKLLTYGYCEQASESEASPFDDLKATAAVLSDICRQAGTTTARALAGLPSS